MKPLLQPCLGAERAGSLRRSYDDVFGSDVKSPLADARSLTNTDGGYSTFVELAGRAELSSFSRAS